MSRNPAFLGALCASLAVIFFSINDATIKLLSSDYALHQVVFTRSIIGLTLVMAILVPLTGGLSVLRTRRLPMHLLRGFCMVAANMTFFLALAAMPIADVVAIFFVSPLLITVFSVIFLRETVGPWRWAAIFVGLAGVLIVVRPGTSAFQAASLLPLAAAVAYAFIHIIARHLSGTESATTMVVYMQTMFILVSLLIGLAVGDGRFGDQSDPSMAFFFRAWHWPDPADFHLFAIIGVGIAGAGYLISQAYRLAEAAYVAPFEYLALPLSILWGVLIFDDALDPITLTGAALIIASGLFTVWREHRAGQAAHAPKTRR